MSSCVLVGTAVEEFVYMKQSWCDSGVAFTVLYEK